MFCSKQKRKSHNLLYLRDVLLFFLLFLRKCGEWKQAAVTPLLKIIWTVRVNQTLAKVEEKVKSRKKTFKDSKLCRLEHPDTFTDPSCVSLLHFWICFHLLQFQTAVSFSLVAFRSWWRGDCTEGGKSHTDRRTRLFQPSFIWGKSWFFLAWLTVFNNPIINWNETVNTVQNSKREGNDSV